MAIVRLSGPGALGVRDRLFRVSHRPPAHGQAVLGQLLRAPGGDVLDQVLCLTWQAPHSYTGEDCVEFQVHGSPRIVQAAIEACLAAGARLAQPGEFTRRAYLNGKLDLAQAEAVCALVQAETDAAERAALAQLQGGLSRRVRELRDSIVPAIAQLEAHVDFPEEGLEPATRAQLGATIDGAIAGIEALLTTSRRGELLREGARVALCGAPNAGKSSLFNALARGDRALVTPHPGTTRDILEARVDIGGVPVTLLDTAGLRATEDPVEVLGVGRAREELARADLLLFVVDRAAPAEHAAAEWVQLPKGRRLLVLNKQDLPGMDTAAAASAFRPEPGEGPIPLSAAKGAGIDALEAAVLARLGGAAPGEGVVVSSLRQREALTAARDALVEAAEGVASSLSPEFIVVDLAQATRALDSITGEHGALDERVLDALFSTFCLGK